MGTLTRRGAGAMAAILPAAFAVSACGGARTPHAGGSSRPTSATVPSCSATQLGVGRPSVGGAMGTLYYLYPIRLRRGPSCTVQGIPTVTPIAGGVRASVRVVDARDPTAGGSWDYRRPVRLDRAHAATLRVAWSDDWCTTPLVVDRLTLGIAGGTVAAPGLGHSPSCYGQPGDPPPPVRVWPVYPSGLRP